MSDSASGIDGSIGASTGTMDAGMTSAPDAGAFDAAIQNATVGPANGSLGLAATNAAPATASPDQTADTAPAPDHTSPDQTSSAPPDSAPAPAPQVNLGPIELGLPPAPDLNSLLSPSPYGTSGASGLDLALGYSPPSTNDTPQPAPSQSIAPGPAASTVRQPDSNIQLAASADDPQGLKMARSAAREGGLKTPDEMRQFHDAITGMGITDYGKLVEIAKQIKQGSY